MAHAYHPTLKPTKQEPAKSLSKSEQEEDDDSNNRNYVQVAQKIAQMINDNNNRSEASPRYPPANDDFK